MRTSTNHVTTGNALISRRVGKRNIALILMIAMTLPSVAIGQSTRPAIQQPPPQLGGQDRASCLLKITCDPTVFPLDKDTVSALLNSAGVAREAFREVFLKYLADIQEPDENVLQVIFKPVGQVVPTPQPPQPLPSTANVKTIMGRLDVDSHAYGGAIDILARICSRLQDVLNQTHKSKLQTVMMQVESANAEVAEAERRLIELQKYRSEWCAKHGRNDLSRPALLGQSNELEKEKQRLEMDVAGQQAQREALQQRIAEIGKQVTASPPEKDPMVNALKLKLQLLRQQQDLLKAMEQRGLGGLGPPSSPAITDVSVQMAMAEAELIQQVQKATAAAGGDALARLNEQLADVSIETAQRMAQHKQVLDRLKNIGDLLTSADEYERKVDVLLPLARQAYEAAVTRQQGLQREIKTLQPPVVTVIGGTDESK